MEQRRLDSARCEKTRRRNPARDAFRTTWELGRCPFPPPPWKSNIRVARLALVSALEKLLSFATSEKPVAVVSFFASSALRRGEGGGRRGGYSSSLLGANRILSRATRLVRSRHLEYNATGGTRIKSTTRRLPPLSWTEKREHRGVSSLHFARTSFPSSMTVPCANTRRRRRSRIDTPTTFPSRSPAKSTRMGRGRRRANTSANALSRFGKLKRKVGVDRSTSNGTFNLLTRGGDYASGSS